jgi:hypothetical protein
MHASHVTNPREVNLDESEGDTWTSHGLKGPQAPKLPQNQVDTGNLSEDGGPIGQPSRERIGRGGPTRG